MPATHGNAVKCLPLKITTCHCPRSRSHPARKTMSSGISPAAEAIHLFYTSHVSSQWRGARPELPLPTAGPNPPPVRLWPSDGHHPDQPPHAAPCETTHKRLRDGPHNELPIVARGGQQSDCSPSRGSSPAPLRTPARPTQTLEPILIPKFRIFFANFPYLHCSNISEAVHLGDLLRICVQPGVRFTPSPPDFQGPGRAHRMPLKPQRLPGLGPLSRAIPGRPALHKEKRIHPGAPASFSMDILKGVQCVGPLTVHSEPCLKSVGYMTKELLKFKHFKK
uniref:Uncharacterized protein n=1 Tax=Hucho hucho TaxID=62062 RepID=A0A4W5Q9N7_9TELE